MRVKNGSVHVLDFGFPVLYASTIIGLKLGLFCFIEIMILMFDSYDLARI